MAGGMMEARESKRESQARAAERSSGGRVEKAREAPAPTPKPPPAPVAPVAPAVPAKPSPAQQAAKIGMQGLAGLAGFVTAGPMGAGIAASGAGKAYDYIRANPSAGAAHGTSGPVRPDERPGAQTQMNPAAPPPVAPQPTLAPMNVDFASMYGAQNMALPPAPAFLGNGNPALAPQQQVPVQPMQPGIAAVQTAMANAKPTQVLQPAIAQAQAAAEGNAPSAAQIMANQRAEQIAKQQMAMAYSRGGFNPGAIRGAQMAGASAQQEALASATALKAQEQAAARQQYANLLSQQGQFDMGAQQNQAQAAQAYASLLGQQQGLNQQQQYQQGTLGLGQQQLAADVAARNAGLDFNRQQATVDAILRSRGLDIQALGVASGNMNEQQRIQIAQEQVAAQERAAQLAAGGGVLQAMIQSY